LENIIPALIQAGPFGIFLILIITGQVYPRSTVEVLKERLSRADADAERALNLAQESLTLHQRIAKKVGVE